MADGIITIGTRRYSSWSLRGWLPVRLAGLDVTERVIPLAGGTTAAVKDASPSGFVPLLEHRGLIVWDSLAIAEYCAEVAPLWPVQPAARARARSIAAEMHSGFPALRREMPMSLFREAKGAGRTAEALVDIARIVSLWTECLEESGGPFLFGADMGNVDAAYAPVVTRFLTYAPDLPDPARRYCDTIRAHPLMEAWYAAAAAEPAEWFIPAMEDPAKPS